MKFDPRRDVIHTQPQQHANNGTQELYFNKRES
jgi:hypothetical protein